MRVLAAESGGHVHFVRIDGEVHERPFLELKDGVLGISVVLVLVHCMAPVLRREGILQFCRDNRNTVDAQNQIDFVRMLRRVP